MRAVRSIPRNDGHQVFVVLTGKAAEIGIEPAVAGADGEAEIVAAVLVLLLPADEVLEVSRLHLSLLAISSGK